MVQHTKAIKRTGGNEITKRIAMGTIHPNERL